MRPIIGDIKSWLSEGRHIVTTTVDDVRADRGFEVRDFPHLVTKVAHLSFSNPSYELLFRGQTQDHKTSSGRSSLIPAIFRTDKRYFTRSTARRRFRQLSKAESNLCKVLQKKHVKGMTTLLRHRILQWSIIQHYEIVRTPLLDVTHSLRVACSFATNGNTNQDVFLYVIAVPYLNGCITTSADQGIQSLRLLSICPPTAHRPHFQEGYLVGEYPDMTLEAKDKYRKEEWDFGQRLIGKFVLHADKFWTREYQPLPHTALCPIDDPFQSIADAVKTSI